MWFCFSDYIVQTLYAGIYVNTTEFVLKNPSQKKEETKADWRSEHALQFACEHLSEQLQCWEWMCVLFMECAGHWPEWFNFNAWSHKCASSAQTRPGLAFTHIDFFYSLRQSCVHAKWKRRAQYNGLDMDTSTELTVSPWPENHCIFFWARELQNRPEQEKALEVLTCFSAGK